VDHDFLHSAVVTALARKDRRPTVMEIPAYNLYDWVPNFGRSIPDHGRPESAVEFHSRLSFAELKQCYPSQRRALKHFRDFPASCRPVRIPGNFTRRPGNRLTYAEVVLKQDYDRFLELSAKFRGEMNGPIVEPATGKEKYIYIPAGSCMSFEQDAVDDLTGKPIEIEQVQARRSTCLYIFNNHGKTYYIKRKYFHQSLKSEIRNLKAMKELGIPTPSLYGHDAGYTMYIGEWLEKLPVDIHDRDFLERIGEAIAHMHNNRSKHFHKSFYCPGNHYEVENCDTFKETFISTLKDTLHLWFKIRENAITPRIKERLITIAKEILERLDWAELKPGEYSWIHGDMTFGNFIFTPQRQIRFIDFPHSMFYDPAYEMAYFSFSPPFFPRDVWVFDVIMETYRRTIQYTDHGFGERFRLYRLVAAFINILIYIKPDPPYHTIFDHKLLLAGNVDYIESRLSKINSNLKPLLGL
jgi:fructosamine-3-kinase